MDWVDLKLSYQALKNQIFEKKQFFIKIDPTWSKKSKSEKF